MEFLKKKGDKLVVEDHRQLLDNSGEINGFIDFLDGFGIKPFQDGIDGQAAFGPDLLGPDFSLERLDKDAGYLSLHPPESQACPHEG